MLKFKNREEHERTHYNEMPERYTCNMLTITKLWYDPEMVHLLVNTFSFNILLDECFLLSSQSNYLTLQNQITILC